MPQPQTLHGAVPLALTPPGKVRKTWALRECLLSSPLPRPLPLCSCCLGSRSHPDLPYNLGKSLLFQGLNEMVEFYNPPSSDIWGPTLILEHTHSFPSLVPNSNLCPLPLQENSRAPLLLSRPPEALPLPWTPVPPGAWAPGHWLPPGLSMPPPVVCRLLCQKPAVPLHPFSGKMNSTNF